MAKKMIKHVSTRSGQKTLMKKPDILIKDIRHMIEEARGAVAVTVNAELTMLYWQIGKRIKDEVLKGKRAEYGEEIVSTLSSQLVPEYGKGFGKRNLFRMIKFTERFPKEKIVSTLLTQLSWSHFLELLQINNDLARDFYAEMCRLECWSVRTLHKKIGGMLFERTAIAKKPGKVIKHEIDTT